MRVSTTNMDAGTEVAPVAQAIGLIQRRRWGLALALAAVAATLATAFAALPALRTTDLPGLPDTTYGGLPLPLGAPQSLVVTLPVGRGQDMRIVDVRTTVSRNAEVVGFIAAIPAPSGPFEPSIGPGFPPHPPDWAMDFREIPATFRATEFSSEPARRHVQVVVGMRATAGDLAALNGVTVHYESNGVRRTKYFPVAYVMCVAPADCEPPQGAASLLQRLGVAKPE